MSFYLPPVQPDTAGMVFTGDALLIKGCGRTDFQQGNAGGDFYIHAFPVFVLSLSTVAVALYCVGSSKVNAGLIMSLGKSVARRCQSAAGTCSSTR
jgi:hypothetical protein